MTPQVIFKERSLDAHKGMFGHGLLIAGSYGMAGTAVLGARAALRSGIGLVSVAIPPENISIVQTAVPEALVKIYDTYPKNLEKYNAIAVGPGISTKERSVTMLSMLLENNVRPMIFDADAINILSENPELMSKVVKDSIFTPHQKEFERLMQGANLDPMAETSQREFTERYGAIVIKKGFPNTITIPNHSDVIIKVGNPGMATGGSGDVLVGIALSLLSQGYSAGETAVLAAYLHGTAGDKAAALKSKTSMIASDIIDCLPDVFKSLE
jgi:NAD(P)H-hydrate epimerase